MTFGDKLREILEQKEIQQVEFAKIMNVSKSSINSYVTNRELPNILMVKSMAEELGVSVDYLLDYQPDPDSLAVSPKEAAILEKFRKLPKEKQEVLISLLEMLSEN